MNRGGPRNTGMVMANNKHGLPGFYLTRAGSVLRVIVHHGTSASVNAHGPREAARLAMAPRIALGLPCPSLAQAVRAINAELALRRLGEIEARIQDCEAQPAWRPTEDRAKAHYTAGKTFTA